MKVRTLLLGIALIPIFVACSGTQSGAIEVVAEAQLTMPLQVNKVTVTATPTPSGASISFDLARDATNPAVFKGGTTVPVGTYSVDAKAYDASSKVVAALNVPVTGVTISKGIATQVNITLLDQTGSAPLPDHSPVVMSVVASPASGQVGDNVHLVATVMDADAGDTLTYAWSASANCGTFSAPTALSTDFTLGSTTGNCTATLTATDSKGLTGSKSAVIQIVTATGSIGVTVTYFPNPTISSIALANGQTLIWSVARTDSDATCHTAVFHLGTQYALTFTYDAADSATVTDNCSGTIVQPATLGATSATAQWTPTAASVAAGACIVNVHVTLQGLHDDFDVVLITAP